MRTVVGFLVCFSLLTSKVAFSQFVHTVLNPPVTLDRWGDSLGLDFNQDQSGDVTFFIDGFKNGSGCVAVQTHVFFMILSEDSVFYFADGAAPNANGLAIFNNLDTIQENEYVHQSLSLCPGEIPYTCPMIFKCTYYDCEPTPSYWNGNYNQSFPRAFIAMRLRIDGEFKMAWVEVSKTVGINLTVHSYAYFPQSDLSEYIIDHPDPYPYTYNVGVEETAAFSVSVFPNPALDILNVSGVPKGSSLSVYDGLGRVVTDIDNGLTTERRIDISKLDPNVYFLRLTYNGGQQIIPFIKL